MANDKLPQEIREQIKTEAEEYKKKPHYRGGEPLSVSPQLYLKTGYEAGATAWAPWKVRFDELKKILELFVTRHEAGLLPDRFVYEKAIKALKGKAETDKNKTMDSKESTASYTKGKWYLQEYTDAYTNIVRCNNGKHETLFIASTPQSSLPEARANAQLISAAPDLLESLQEIIAITDRDHAAWAKAKAAIDKALQQYKDGTKGKEVVRLEHNVSIGEHITYCRDCGFPVNECNCIDNNPTK